MKRQVFVNGREVPFKKQDLSAVHEVEPGVYSVLWKGNSFEVRIVGKDSGYIATIGRFRFGTEARDPRDASYRSQASLSSGRQNLTAPMPGKVIRVLVQEGQEVVPGQGLIVVEAMKMQNEMKAVKAGRVSAVLARDGDTVGEGQVLITIE